MTIVVVAIVASTIALQLILLQQLKHAAGRAQAAIQSPSVDHLSEGPAFAGFFWTAWCRECRVEDPQAGPVASEAIMGKVRSWWESLAPHMILQRVGVMAPLIGVIFTAFGLLTLKAPVDDGAMDIRGAMMPFGWGIGGGALIAILNQCILLLSDFLYRDTERAVRTFLANAEASSSRCRDEERSRGASSEFDALVSRLSATIDPLAGALADATRHLDSSQAIQEACLEAMRSLAHGTRQLDEQAARQRHATDAFVEAVEKVILPSQKTLNATARRINEVATTLAEPLEGLLRSAEQLVTGCDTAARGLAAFQKGTEEFARTVDEGFVPSADIHRRAAMDLEAMVARSRQAADGFVSGINRFAKSFEYQHEVTDRIVELIDQQAAPAYELLAKSARVLETSTASLAEHSNGFRMAVLEQAAFNQRIQESSDAAMAALANASISLTSHTTKVFAEPVAASAELLARFSQVPAKLEALTASAQASADAMSALCQERERVSVASEASLTSTKMAADRLMAVTATLEESVNKMAIALTSVGDFSAKFNYLSDSNAEKIRTASEPLGRQLTALTEVLTSLAVQEPRSKRSFIGRVFGGA